MEHGKGRRCQWFFVAFNSTLNQLYCDTFPLKCKFLSSKRCSNPWINNSLHKLLKSKSDYFRLFKLGAVTKIENNIYRNKVQSIVKQAKTLYYKKLFNLNKCNTSNTWKVIKSLIASDSVGKLSIKKIVYENITYLNTSDISELFNNYYVNIAKEIENNLPCTNIDPMSYIVSNYSSFFCGQSLYLNVTTFSIH